MKPLRIGFIPLSDCAVLAVAAEKGFFRRHGLAATLSREVSWANVRDKVAVGALDGAQRRGIAHCAGGRMLIARASGPRAAGISTEPSL